MKIKFLRTAVLLLVTIFSCQSYLHYQSGKYQEFKVHFLNVGQGDAILLSKGANQILIDGGISSEKLLDQLRNTMPPQDNRIELVVLSHPDKDHFGGLTGAFEHFEVNCFIEGSTGQGEEYENLKKILAKRNVRELIVEEGTEIKIGNNLTAVVFSPNKNTEPESGEKNDRALVMRFDFGVSSFLFTGDIGFEQEKELISDGENIDADWLKVAHHGSKNSTGEDFLKAVTPQYAIISVGKNSYGHPTDETLTRLKDSGASVLRTDESGTITVSCPNFRRQCFVQS